MLQLHNEKQLKSHVGVATTRAESSGNLLIQCVSVQGSREEAEFGLRNHHFAAAGEALSWKIHFA